MPGHTRDLRETRDYSGKLPIQARWRHPSDPRVRREKSFATKKEAKKWMAEMDTDADRGVWVDPTLGRETLGRVAADWLEAKRIECGPRTIMSYESILKAHIVPAFGTRRIAGIEADDVQKWVRSLASKRSPATVRSIHLVLRMVLLFAVERKLIAAAPVGVRLPQTADEEVNALTHGQVRTLAAAMPDELARVAVLTATYSGLRAGELWALKRNDLNLLKRTLRVDEALKQVTAARAADDLPYGFERVGDRLILGPPKTRAGKRTLPIPDFLADELAAFVEPGNPNGFIFTDDGEPITHGNFYKRVYLPNVPAVLKGTTWHCLRHTCASLLIDSARSKGINDDGIIAWQISKYLGHKNIKTTLEVYSHLLPGAQESLAASLDAGWRAAEQEPAQVLSLAREAR